MVNFRAFVLLLILNEFRVICSTPTGKPIVDTLLDEFKTKSHQIFFKTAQPCSDDQENSRRCYTDGKSKLSIQEIKTGVADVSCSTVVYEAVDCTLNNVTHCEDMSSSHWYGGTIIRNLHWPVEKWSYSSTPYVTGDSYQATGGYGGVQERYWLNSEGRAYYIDFEIPLWVSINESNSHEICFKAQYQDSPYKNVENSPVKLSFTTCSSSDIKEVHAYMIKNYFKQPNTIPDVELFRNPIWSTWAQYKADIDQEKVLEFANQIISNDFSYSQLEIDDRWEAHYGDMDFDLTKFPDPKTMVRDLANLGFRTTIWVHPFVNLNSPSFNEITAATVFVRQSEGALAGLTSWWQGRVAGIVDFTGSIGKQWFDNRIRALRDNYNISSFKFDAGETNWLPKGCYGLAENSVNPTIYSTRYAEAAYALDDQVRHQEVRVGAQTQHLPIFVRMMDKDSQWGYNNGLQTLIPHTLNFGIIGYPYILPDMVGGNAYGSLPDRELFIRWMEVNVFLPSIQFSITPWQFDAELVTICRKMLALRQRYTDLMISIASSEPGAPIVRPLWWIAPLDEIAQSIDSEFLVGDALLVAPVLYQGARARDIYLPAGTWRDELRGTFYISSGEWVINYRAELDELPYFTKVQ